jgi:hypothetical protein
MIEILDIALDLAFDAGGLELARIALLRLRHLAGRGASVAAALAVVGAGRMLSRARAEVDAFARWRADVAMFGLRRVLAE